MFRTDTIQDELSRTAKILLDSGEAATLEEAYRILGTYRLSVRVGTDLSTSPTLQATLLTIVNTARRCFLGGVEVSGCPGSDLLVHVSGCRTIKEAVVKLQGRLVDTPSTEHPEIVVGDADAATSSEFAVRTTFEGWVGGVAPINDRIRLRESQEFTPAGVLAGSLAVSEAFQFVRGTNAPAGWRSVGLSLWEPHSGEDWSSVTEFGPALEILPARLWLIGLGHLGQAYLWTLGLLPYASPEEVMIVLQDTDKLTIANDSTSPLTSRDMVGQYKTRAIASWCEVRGFNTRIVERLFTDDFAIAADEPMVALCGVDNPLARSALEGIGFARVIEAGIGRGTDEYLAFQIHSFPGPKAARQIWGATPTEPSSNPPIDAAAYLDLGERGLDQCGLTMLANRAVGAAFVGTFASTLVIAEVLRTIAGGALFDVIDATLRAPAEIEAIPTAVAPAAFNPGMTPARPSLAELEVPVSKLEEAPLEIR